MCIHDSLNSLCWKSFITSANRLRYKIFMTVNRTICCSKNNHTACGITIKTPYFSIGTSGIAVRQEIIRQSNLVFDKFDYPESDGSVSDFWFKMYSFIRIIQKIFLHKINQAILKLNGNWTILIQTNKIPY